MKKNIIVFVAGAVTGALGMKVAPKLISSLKRDDDAVDELMDEFDNIVDSFEEPKEAPTAEPTEEPKAEPTETAPSPEKNGDEMKGGENNE